jgi:glutamine synthetase type III
MEKDLEKIAKEKGIKYFLVSWVDMFGMLRSKLVPTRAIKGMQKNGAGFAGFAAYLDLTPAHPDLFGMPDPDSFIQIPWQKEIGWVACDLWMDGKPLEASPRVALKRQLARAEKLGYRMKTGVECEFHLINKEGTALADDMDTHSKPCYDQQAVMRQYPIISKIADAMLELEWNPYQNDHEDANGQFEMNWDYDDALKTADRHVFFKYMTRAICEDHGIRATFMPKPFMNLTGNGCHAHMSIWDLDGKKNLFSTDGEADARGLGLSPLAYQFLGGIMESAVDLTAIFNPTVNSFKRINAPRTLSGATWAPNAVTYGGNNRTHMVRVPDAGRFELRLMDGAVNPYLLQAGMLAAGLDGVENNRDPGDPLDINMYEEGHLVTDARHLPENLLDAIRLFDNNKIMRKALGDEFVDAFVKLKMRDWNEFTHDLSPWERQHTLDC